MNDADYDGMSSPVFSRSLFLATKKVNSDKLIPKPTAEDYIKVANEISNSFTMMASY